LFNNGQKKKIKYHLDSITIQITKEEKMILQVLQRKEVKDQKRRFLLILQLLIPLILN